MEMQGERQIGATRARVFAALNDPEILRAAIPGCQSLEAEADGLRAVAAVKIGPIAARFSGTVRLSDLNPPVSYRIEGSGQGGPAGFARGSALVELKEAEAGAATLLCYQVRAEIGGKLAQLGARLIDASARQMADQFFEQFAAALMAREAGEAAAPAAGGIDLLALRPLGFPLFAWAGLGLLLVFAAVLLAG